jgi:phage-related protein
VAGYGKQVGKLSIKVLPNAAQFRADIDKLIERVERTKRVLLPVQADTKRASAELQQFVNRWSREVIGLDVDAHTKEAAAQLAAIARERTALIKAKVDKKNAQQIAVLGASIVQQFHKIGAGATASLTGLRVVSDVFGEIREKVLNLDRSTGPVSRLSVAVAGLGASLLNTVGALTTVAGDMLKVVNLGLVLPAAFAGAVTGIVVLSIALKDAKTQLASLGPAMNNLGDIMKRGFWAEARQPILDFVNKYLPQLNEGFGNVASAIGRQAAVFTNTLSTALGGGVLEGMFGKLVETIDIVTPGIASLVNAFVKLGEVGSTFLPRLGAYFTELAGKFDAWVQSTSESGEMFGFIEAGIQAFLNIGRAIDGVAGIFRAVDSAATAAGFGGLTTFADALQGAATILQSPAVQTALTTFFAGAKDGIAGVAPGMQAFGNMLIALAPTFATVMGLAGDTIGTLLGAISDAMQQPMFKDGLVALFAGIKQGAEGLVPAIGPMADLFGLVMAVIGRFAATLGPVLASLKIAFAPVIESLITAAMPLIPLFGSVLIGLFNGLTGPLQALAGFITENQAMFTALIGTVAIVAPILASAATGFLALVQVAGGFKNALTVLTVAWRILSAAFTASPIGLLITAIVLLVAGLIYFFTQTELGKALWQNFVDFIVAVFQNVVQFFSAVWDLIVALFTAYIQTLVLIFTTVGAVIAGVWQAIWNGILSVIQVVWAFIVAVVTTYINLVVTVITTVVNAIVGVWTAVWNAISSVVGAVWNAIVSFVTSGINTARTIIANVIKIIQAIWSGNWDQIGQYVSNIWNAIRSFVQNGLNQIQNVINSVMNAVRSIWQSIWQGMVSVVTGIVGGIMGAVNGLTSAVRGAIDGVVGTVRGVQSTITGIFSNAGAWLADSGRKIVQGLADGIRNAVGKATEAINGVVSAVRDFLPFSPAKRGPFSGKGWTPHSGRALAVGFADGIADETDTVRRAAEAMANAASVSATVGLDNAASSIDNARSAFATLLERREGDQIVVQGGVGYDPESIAREIALKKRQAALAAGLNRVQVA